MFAQRRSSRGLFVRLAILCCLLALTLSYRGAGVAQDDPGASDPIILRRIIPDDRSPAKLIRLDPDSLADESTSSALDPDSVLWNIVVSRDGQTLAGIGSGPEIIVKNGLDGPILSRIPTDGGMVPQELSADGSTLIVSTHDNGFFGWKTFDTATGTVQSTSDRIDGNMRFYLMQVVDPIPWTLYQLVPETPSATGLAYHPGPANVVAIDLATGDEVGRVLLPDITIGSWPENDADATMPILHDILPAIAISPDGMEIAVVSADSDRINLIDAKSLTLKKSLSMHVETGLIDHLFSILPLMPESAKAKGSEGVKRVASYAADGRHLFVSGNETESGNPDSESNAEGLSLIDLGDGAIEAHILDGVMINRVVEGADGNLYVAGDDYRNPPKEYRLGFLVARLDGASGKVLAEQTFYDEPVMILNLNVQSYPETERSHSI